MKVNLKISLISRMSNDTLTPLRLSHAVFLSHSNDYQQIVIDKNENQHEYYCSRASTVGVLRSPSVFLKIADISDKIQVSPGEVSVYENGLAKFHCNIFSYPSANITWWHNDELIEINESSTKYIMGQSGELYINSIQQTDSGFYKCKARNIFINQDDKVSNSGQLKVLSLSSGEDKKYTNTTAYYTEVKSIHEVPSGERLKIICGASGYYPPNISWLVFNSSGQFELTNTPSISILEFENINVFHTGDYYCTTEDQIIFHHIKIKVGLPPLSINQHTNFILKNNNELKFKCQVDGEPKPTITWFKNLKEIQQNDSRFTVTKDPSVFRIKDIGSEDTGEYQCVAKNIHGEYWNAGHFEFDNMHGINYIPKLATCSVISSNAINVSWVASETIEKNKYNNYTVEYWKTDDLNEKVLIESTQETFLNIKGLKKYTNYSFHVRLWGPHRCSLPSNTVTCKILDNYDVNIKKENTTERILKAHHDELIAEENHTSDNITLGIVIGIFISVIFIGITIGYVCYLKRRSSSTYNEFLNSGNETPSNNETEMVEIFQNLPSAFPHSLGVIPEQLIM
ncbi:hypothetical protein HCN44_008204 [Aphidius gifuensis]|uniref:Uncharacterized protein n=1 Tax=Aphidius gifuensis TaxID=684658 RepID=A0A834XQA1_APHGI|nr:hypothetical protein HCN44_008204 [Aphidius gifuensis]